MFEREKPRYCSRGIAEELPMNLQAQAEEGRNGGETMQEPYIKVWKTQHLANLPEQVPEAAKRAILDGIQTLNQNYGEERDVDGDPGGYLAVFPEPYSKEVYQALLSRYHLQGQKPEHAGLLCGAGNVLWVREAFLCRADYHLVIISPVIL